MPSSAADRNLLFGILALQMDFISRDALIQGMHAWVLDKSKPLGQILVETGALSARVRDVVDVMIDTHVAQHGNDPQQSLAALSSVGSEVRDLARIGDADVLAALATLPPPVGARPSDEDGVNAIATLSFPGTADGRGRFRILRPHAEGGLGTVSVALDQELQREVALKEIKEQYVDSPEARARFLLEAEITGALEHPGIVPVYSLGSYGDGRPFYAMRFIKGDSLKQAIQQFHHPTPRAERPAGSADFHSLAFRKLLGRFVDVCNAVAYAHSRGVLHRDLKPGNIMLGKYGETLVVDWGLARTAKDATTAQSSELVVRPTASASGSTLTVAGMAMGTPAYMSPEQAAGRLDQLGPPADVYSLGATLYHLLTGQAAFAGSDPVELLAQIQLGEFPRPRQVMAEVPAALEAICLKAMAVELRDRYATTRELGEEIERWLADKPVRAWPEPWTIKTGRWVRGHKPLVSGMAAALLVGMFATAAGLLWHQDELNRRANELNRRANARATAEASAREALKQAQQRRADLHAILQKPGGVFTLLNEPARWQAHVEGATAALDRARVLLANADGAVDPQLSMGIANLHALLDRDEEDRKLANYLDAIRMEHVGWAWTVQAYGKALPDVTAKTADAATVAARFTAAPIKEQLLATLDNWALTAWAVDTDKDLVPHLLDIARRMAPDPAWGDRVRQDGAWSDKETLAKLAEAAPVARLSPVLLDLIGMWLVRDGHPLREPWYRRAQWLHPGDFWLNLQLADVLYHNGKSAEAEGYYRAALVIRPRSYRIYHVYNNLGNALHHQNKLPEAIAAYEKAIDNNAHHPFGHNNKGTCLREQNKLAEAIVAFAKAVEVEPRFVTAYLNLGSAQYDLQQWGAAIATYRKALEVEPHNFAARKKLGETLVAKGRPDEAIAEYQQAMKLDPKLPDPHYSLGTLLFRQGRFEQAAAAMKQARELMPAGHPLRADAERNLKQYERMVVLDRYVATRAFTGLREGVTCVAVHAGSKRVVTGVHKTVRRWDLESGTELPGLEGHTDVIWALALSPDGKRTCLPARSVRCGSGIWIAAKS